MLFLVLEKKNCTIQTRMSKVCTVKANYNALVNKFPCINENRISEVCISRGTGVTIQADT